MTGRVIDRTAGTKPGRLVRRGASDALVWGREWVWVWVWGGPASEPPGAPEACTGTHWSTKRASSGPDTMSVGTEMTRP